jgi:hypothetical protein
MQHQEIIYEVFSMSASGYLTIPEFLRVLKRRSPAINQESVLHSLRKMAAEGRPSVSLYTVKKHVNGGRTRYFLEERGRKRLESEVTETQDQSDAHLEVYVDASFESSVSPVGIGVWIPQLNRAYSFQVSAPSSSAAERMAISKGRKIAFQLGYQKVRVISDCQGVTNSINATDPQMGQQPYGQLDSLDFGVQWKPRTKLVIPDLLARAGRRKNIVFQIELPDNYTFLSIGGGCARELKEKIGWDSWQVPRSDSDLCSFFDLLLRYFHPAAAPDSSRIRILAA